MMMTQDSYRRAKTPRHTLTGVLLALALFLVTAGQASAAECPAGLESADLIDHNLTVSFCELCEIGTVQLEIENPYRDDDEVDFSDIRIREDLGLSGLTYAGNASFSGDNLAPPADFAPDISGLNGSVLTWDLPSAYVIDGYPGGSGNRRRLILEFDVKRHDTLTEEGL